MVGAKIDFSFLFLNLLEKCYVTVIIQLAYVIGSLKGTVSVYKAKNRHPPC